MNFLNIAQRVISEEAAALNSFSSQIPEDFPKVIEAILETKGRVITSGMGKSGYIARKIASSLASTGTPAFYIHPGEASHGDLGMITKTDIVILLSNSGETKELFDIVNYCKRFHIKMVTVTMKPESTIAKNSDLILNIPVIKEASLLSAPTTSALTMLALGDAIIISLHETKGFSKDDFFVFHPGGKIGADLLKVKDLMFTKNALPLVGLESSFAEVILIMTEKSLGCAAVVDDDQNLKGIITYGDLRRNIDKNLSSLKAGDIMTKLPKSVNSETLASEALFIMNSSSITALPVTDNTKIVGIIHIHDILRSGVNS